MAMLILVPVEIITSSAPVDLVEAANLNWFSWLEVHMQFPSLKPADLTILLDVQHDVILVGRTPVSDHVLGW
jgi:hypothetical protein